jgi:hypothetical protein
MAEPQAGQEIQNEIMNAIGRSQAAVVDTIEKCVTTVQSLRPDLPQINLPFADSLKMPDSIKIAGQLPRPEQLVKTAYDLAEQLLASQRKFAEDLLKATAPLTGGPGRDATTGDAESGT